MENDKLKEKEALMEGKTYTTKVIRIFFLKEFYYR